MSTQNICFYGEIRKIFMWISISLLWSYVHVCISAAEGKLGPSVDWVCEQQSEK